MVGSVKGQTQKAVTWLLHHQRSESTRGSLPFCNTVTRTRRLKGAPRLDPLSRKWQRIFQSRATCRLQPLWHPLFCPLSLTQGKAPVPTAQEGTGSLPPTSAHLLPGVLSPKSGSCSESTPKLAIVTAPTRLGANSRDTSCSLPSKTSRSCQNRPARARARQATREGGAPPGQRRGHAGGGAVPSG